MSDGSRGASRTESVPSDSTCTPGPAVPAVALATLTFALALRKSLVQCAALSLPNRK